MAIIIIAGEYSFNGGKEYIERCFSGMLLEIKNCINAIDKEQHKHKESQEKTMRGKRLYSPISLNNAFKNFLSPLGWSNHKVKCDYPTGFYTNNYEPEPLNSGSFRDMDFVKDRLGVEVQFGKYSFMVYNVCAKMTIFKNMGVIDAGIEIVPIKDLANDMSTGVSYFEQFVWDLEQRGVSDIDIPVLILGII